MFKRFKNLWRLSEWDITLSDDKKTIFIDSTPARVVQRRKEATIVDTDDPLQIDLGEQDI